MRKIIILFASLALSACSLLPSPSRISQIAAGKPAQTVAIEANKAFTLAVLSYEALANGLLASAEAGLIKGKQAENLRQLNKKALELIDRGNSALDQGTKAAITGELLPLIWEMRTLAVEIGDLVSWDLTTSSRSAEKQSPRLLTSIEPLPKQKPPLHLAIWRGSQSFGNKLSIERKRLGLGWT